MLIDDFNVREADPKQPCSVIFPPVAPSVPMSLFLAHSQRVGGQAGIGDSIAQIDIALGLAKTHGAHCWHTVKICPGEEGQSESLRDVRSVSCSNPSILSSLGKFT